MKKSLFLVLALLALSRAFAQTTTIPVEPSIPQQLDSLFKPLNKAEITSGLLFSKAIPLVEPTDYAGSTAPKTLTFTFFIRQNDSGGGKTQHRRTQPQPSPLASRCGSRTQSLHFQNLFST